MTRARFGLIVLTGIFGTTTATAQEKEPARVKEPARAEKLDIQVRYRIRADRDERIRQYRVLEKHLASLGFDDARKNDPDRDLDVLDPRHERFTGAIPSARVFDVLNDPRVQNILFAPAGYAYPDSPLKPVPIRVQIRGGLLLPMQQLFHAQTIEQLELLGFKNALGYDTRDFTLIKGTILLKSLDKLVKDLRTEPAGWFLPHTPGDQLPRPFADRNPIRWVEVMPAVEPVAEFVPEVVLPARAGLTPDLRALLQDPASKEAPVRVIVLFNQSIEEKAEDLRVRLSGGYGPTVKRGAGGNAIKGPDGQPALTEGASLDGVAGNLASIRFDRPADAERFAFEPNVLSIRLPRQAAETISPLPAEQKAATAAEVQKATGMDALHRLGYTGAGVKIVIVGTDFTGAEALVGTALPKKTRIIDLTTELNPDIVPSAADPNRVGNGTAAAKAAALSAPGAEFVLVRIDPGSIFQLFGIIRIARGEAVYTPAMRSRLIEISNKTTEMNRRKESAITEYKLAFDDLSDDDVTKARRTKAKTALDAVIAEQAALIKRTQRFTAFQKDVLAAFTGVRVLINTVEWESGFPLDSMSQLSRTLEVLATSLPAQVTKGSPDGVTPAKHPIVFVQAASGAGPAVWGGAFLDANRNGAMEFATPDRPLPPSNWSPEMNFLGVRAANGATTADLAAGTKLRFTLQWREPIDPNVPRGDQPVYPVRLHVWRQLDPTGTKQPSDEMAEVARSIGGPYPIQLARTYVVFEQILEFNVGTAGRYALIVATGQSPEPLLPALRRHFEVYPRVVIETLTAKPGDGQVVFRSYTAIDAGVGIPGDSLGAITVGVPGAAELRGGGTGLTLRVKPDYFGPAALDVVGNARGSGVATGYVGGMAAVMVQAGAAGTHVFQSAKFEPGKLAVVPEAWLKFLRPVAKPEK